MAAQIKTKQAPKVTKKQSKQTLAHRFANLRRRFQLLIVVVLMAVIGGGGYLIGQSRAADVTWTIQFCRKQNVVLRQGSNNACVKAVQKVLSTDKVSWRYCNSDTIGVDGAFGPQTDRMVRCYQGHRGLTKDGVIGWNTYTALLNSCTKEAYQNGNLRLRPYCY